MERIPETELMDDTEQARAYALADFSEAHDAFVSHFALRFPSFAAGEVLDLGCGTADVVIRFAKRFPGASITGVDGAEAMLSIGRKEIEQKNLSGQISLYRCFLPDTGLSSRRYDAVISNSLLHHLSDPGVLWDTVRESAKPDASIFIMDLLRPDSTEEARELVTCYAGDASSILQKDFYNSLLAAYRMDEIGRQLKAASLTGLTAEIISDRHLIVWGGGK